MGMGRPGPGLEPGPYGLRAKLWGHGPAQSTICIWPHWPNGHNGLTHSSNITYIVNITLIMQWRWHQHVIIFNSAVNHHQQTLLQQQSWWYWYINNFIQFFHCSAAECHWIACLLACPLHDVPPALWARLYSLLTYMFISTSEKPPWSCYPFCWSNLHIN